MGKGTILTFGLLSLFCSCMNQGKRFASETETEVADSIWNFSDSILDGIDKKEVFTCISEDGRMRFHSWNTGLGGTCPDYGVLCQYLTEDGQPVTVDLRDKEGEPGWVAAVHSIRKDDGSTYYITSRTHRASSNDGYAWMDGFMIDMDTLKYVGVFNGGDDLDECILEINYDISKWYHATDGEGWDLLFEYNAQTRNLYIPIVVYTDDPLPVVSDRYWLYHFDGQEFVDKGEVAHKYLHQSLSDYVRLVKYCKTKDGLVRIDIIDDKDTLRFALWKSAPDMSEKPDLIIMGGEYDAGKDTYTFISNGHEYVV